jgi:hypothetical protein
VSVYGALLSLSAATSAILRCVCIRVCVRCSSFAGVPLHFAPLLHWKLGMLHWKCCHACGPMAFLSDITALTVVTNNHSNTFKVRGHNPLYRRSCEWIRHDGRCRVHGKGKGSGHSVAPRLPDRDRDTYGSDQFAVWFSTELGMGFRQVRYSTLVKAAIHHAFRCSP